jgi:ubiquinone/menaquinone biosynthesis C-methylase UbiE
MIAVVGDALQPNAFDDTFVAMAGARAIISATRLGVVASLAEEPCTPGELASRLGLSASGTEALLTALRTLGYLAVDGSGVHRPTAAGAQLVPGESASVASFVGDYNAHAWEMLGHLDEALRGEHTPESHARALEDPFWDSYIRGLFELARDEHEENVQRVPAAHPRTLLDIAGGHGGFAMAMCAGHEHLRATVLDLPASVRVGRSIVAEEGFAGQVSFLEGNALESDLGSDWDVVSMFNLLHHLSPQAVLDLLGRARRALRPGGWLVVGETERTEPGQPVSLNGAMSGLVYFVSSATRNYTRGELVDWLGQAGFARVQVHRNARSPWRLLYLATESAR